MQRSTLREVAVPLLSLVVLVGLGYLAYTYIANKRVRPLDGSGVLVSPEGKINLGPTLDSAVLPTSIPVPADAYVNQYFDIATKDGQVQGTRSYQSSRTVAEEVEAYEKFLAINQWKVVDRKLDTQYASILATRENQQLLASFSARSGQTYTTVSAMAAPAVR